jgi:DNA-binding winged helix-turn-helix (wHTH) protein
MYVKESPMPTDLLAARVFQIPGPDQPTATPDTATSHPGPVPPTPFSSAAAPQATPERAVTQARAQAQLPADATKAPARNAAGTPARNAARTVIPAAARALGAVLPEGTLRPEPGLPADLPPGLAEALPAELGGLTSPDEPGSGGTLLAVVPIPGTDSSLAIVGYTVPAGVARDRVQAPRQADGGLVVDHARRCVWLSGREVQLTYQEFELLAFLSANPAQVFSRADLLQQVWGQRENSRHHTRTVDVHVSRLRRKLGPVFGQCLTTEHRVGYRFDPTMDVSV